MYINFYDSYIEIIEDKEYIPGFKKFPEIVCKANKFKDIPHNILNLLSDNQIDDVFYFFNDLEII